MIDKRTSILFWYSSKFYYDHSVLWPFFQIGVRHIPILTLSKIYFSFVEYCGGAFLNHQWFFDRFSEIFSSGNYEFSSNFLKEFSFFLFVFFSSSCKSEKNTKWRGDLKLMTGSHKKFLPVMIWSYEKWIFIRSLMIT